MSDINIGLLAENQNLSEFEITNNFSCVRFLDKKKERFLKNGFFPENIFFLFLYFIIKIKTYSVFQTATNIDRSCIKHSA